MKLLCFGLSAECYVSIMICVFRIAVLLGTYEKIEKVSFFLLLLSTVFLRKLKQKNTQMRKLPAQWYILWYQLYWILIKKLTTNAKQILNAFGEHKVIGAEYSMKQLRCVAKKYEITNGNK